MKILTGLCCTGLFASMTSFAIAATMTLPGIIGGNCDAASRAKILAMHKDTKMTDRDLALACVKDGGKFVFAAGRESVPNRQPESGRLGGGSGKQGQRNRRCNR
jgi:hypothetical protein